MYTRKQNPPPYVEYYRNEPFTLPRRNTPILSSLKLQQLLFYNILFDIPFLLLHFILFLWRHEVSTNWKIKYLAPIGLVMLFIVEPCRVYAGWVGNLREKGSHLSTFLFLTFFFSPIVTLFLMGMQAPLLPIDKVFGYIYIFLFVIEFVIGVLTLRRVIQYKTIRFRVEIPVPANEADFVHERLVNATGGSELYKDRVDPLRTIQTDGEEDSVYDPQRVHHDCKKESKEMDIDFEEVVRWHGGPQSFLSSAAKTPERNKTSSGSLSSTPQSYFIPSEDNHYHRNYGPGLMSDDSAPNTPSTIKNRAQEGNLLRKKEGSSPNQEFRSHFKDHW